MNTAAKLFIEGRIDEFREIGDVVNFGEIGFFDKKSIFLGDAARKKKRPLKTCIGAMALLVSPAENDVDWSAFIKAFCKDRTFFRVEYPDGELHTMDCVARAPGGHSPYLHVQLYLCAEPVIDRAAA